LSFLTSLNLPGAALIVGQAGDRTMSGKPGRPQFLECARKFSISVDGSLWLRLIARADYEGVSVSALARQAITDYLRVHHDHLNDGGRAVERSEPRRV
jgi:hypothetical protein